VQLLAIQAEIADMAPIIPITSASPKVVASCRAAVGLVLKSVFQSSPAKASPMTSRPSSACSTSPEISGAASPMATSAARDSLKLACRSSDDELPVGSNVAMSPADSTAAWT